MLLGIRPYWLSRRGSIQYCRFCMEFQPGNELEEALVHAANDPAARPRFYELLLESDLFVLTPPNAIRSNTPIANRNSVSFVQWSDGKRNIIPVFTSLAMLERILKVQSDGPAHLAFLGRELLRILARGTTSAVLNPNGPFGKELLVEEMRDLATGDFFSATRSQVLEKGRSVLLSVPANYPYAAVDALKRFLATRPEISAAYLAQLHDPASGDAPHLLFGLLVTGDVEHLMRPLAVIARDVLGSGRVADFTVLGRGGAMDEYFFKNMEPFYRRTAEAPERSVAIRIADWLWGIFRRR